MKSPFVIGTGENRQRKTRPYWFANHRMLIHSIATVFFMYTSLASAQEPTGEIDKTPPQSSDLNDSKPEFPGGAEEFYKFIIENYQTPQHPEMKSGKIVVQFNIEEDGSITNVKSVQDLGFGSGEEAVRVVQSSPKWKPKMIHGKPVCAKYSIPIKITVAELFPAWPEDEVRVAPKFPGGEEALQSFFKENFNGNGTFIVNFVIETDGMLTFITCNVNASADNCAEIKRVLNAGPKWTPAIRNGGVVRAQLTRKLSTK